jgi:hypothetical protein
MRTSMMWTYFDPGLSGSISHGQVNESSHHVSFEPGVFDHHLGAIRA